MGQSLDCRSHRFGSQVPGPWAVATPLHGLLTRPWCEVDAYAAEWIILAVVVRAQLSVPVAAPARLTSAIMPLARCSAAVTPSHTDVPTGTNPGGASPAGP